MIDTGTVLQIGSLVGTFLGAVYLSSKKITAEASKTRSIVREFALDPQQLSTDLRIEMERNFVDFQRLHSTRYSELNQILSESLEQQSAKDRLYLSEIDALRGEVETIKKQIIEIRNITLTGDVPDDMPTLVFKEKVNE